MKRFVVLIDYPERVPEVYGPWDSRAEAQAWLDTWDRARVRRCRIISLDYLHELLAPAWEQ